MNVGLGVDPGDEVSRTEGDHRVGWKLALIMVNKALNQRDRMLFGGMPPLTEDPPLMTKRPPLLGLVKSRRLP